MERKSFLGIVIGALLGLLLLFLAYMYFFNNEPGDGTVRNPGDSYFPIAGNDIPVFDTNNDGIPDDAVTNPNTTVIIPTLRRMSLSPAAGYITFDRATTTKTITGTSTVRISTTTEMAVRYVEKSTGHIFEANENTLNIDRISNTTLGIFDKAFFSNASSFVAQRFNTDSALIDTYIGTLVRVGTSTPELRTTGAYFPRNPEVIAVRGTSLFALYQYPLNSEGFLTQISPVKEVKVFASPLSGWNAEWINRDRILLTTEANSGYDGYAHSLNPTTGAMTELFGPKPGLTARINSTLTGAFTSESYANTFAFFAHNLTDDTFFQLSSATLPEKCVFSTRTPMIAYCAVPRPMPFGSYPEDWYKGKVQFDDALVMIDLEKNQETTIVNLAQEGGVVIDAINLSLNEKETHLVFQNKRDNYVWSYDLRLE